MNMGKGGYQTGFSYAVGEVYSIQPFANGRQPTEKPPFTIGTLRKAIPQHCFKRSLFTSSAYLAANLAAVALLYLCSTAIDSLPTWARLILWPVYWFCQVIFMPSRLDYVPQMISRCTPITDLWNLINQGFMNNLEFADVLQSP